MFFKKIKNIASLLLFITLIIPINVFAYSSHIIPGGESVGIEINTKEVLIVGTYQVDGLNPAKDAGLRNGDKLISINSIKIESINDMVNAINNSKTNTINIDYMRSNKIKNTTLDLVRTKDDVLKTGLYVKDSITGLGTITFIDPESRLFGALGHEILEKNTGQKVEIKSGKIFNSKITSIDKSTAGTPGEKNATFNSNIKYGQIFENTQSGIFGNYTSQIDNSKLLKVALFDEIKLGNATIRTVIKDEKVEEFDIKIIRLNENAKIKNILFEIIDPTLLEETGGIVQGMSGSPIIQNNMIIGAVTHVVVEDTNKGYGIFIRTMLEEAEN